MSLHIGRLPPHVHPEELERVFWRFGRCNLNLKDGYGFVVYDVSENAGRALRFLRGKIICGEQISLSWSNRQPGNPERFSRNPRFNELHRRDFRDGYSRNEFRPFHGRREFPRSPHAETSSHFKHDSDGAFDRQADNADEDVDVDTLGDKAGPNSNEVREGGANERSQVQNNRLGDAVVSHDARDDIEFDRYQPDHGLDKSYESENDRRAHSYSSQYRSSWENDRREISVEDTRRHPNKLNNYFTCYHCGKPGHIARNCRDLTDGNERFKFYHERDDDMDFIDRYDRREKRFRSNYSWGKSAVDRDPPMSLRSGRSRKEDSSMIARRDAGKDESSPDAKEKRPRKHRAAVKEIKSKKKKRGSSKREAKKRKSRRFRTSSHSSSSRSTSRSTSSRSHSTARSKSSGSSHSGRLRSRSSSRSPSSKSSSPKSQIKPQLRSRSSSLRLSSLSISLDDKSLSSPKNEKEISSDLIKNKSPKPKIQSPVQLNVSKLGSAYPSSIDVDTFVSIDKDEDINGAHPEYDGEAAQYSVPNIEPNGSGLNAKTMSTGRSGETAKPLNSSSSNPNGGFGIDSTRISTGEMFTALRHYGLVVSGENELDISAERYLGAARLWPWEIIYFRRTKKGPISLENYARRLEQNREFGIVDKYVRGSSGWGQFTEKEP